MRLFLLPANAATGSPGPDDEIVLGADETHHLTRVLRAVPGAAVLLADGHGRFLDGELVAVRGGRAVVAIRVVRDDPWERDGPRLVLACGLVKGPRFTWALEKAVELGAHAIRPLRTGRAVVDPGEGRQGRWEAVVRAAAKQAGRSLVPEVHAPDTLAGCLAALPGARFFYGEEDARRESTDGVSGGRSTLDAAALLRGGVADRDVLVWVVGPEGGWTAAERLTLAEAGAAAVRLGPHRLRTETAAAAGLVLLQAVREARGRRAAGASDRGPS